MADTTAACAILPSLARYWPRNTLRQTAPGTPHRDTESIYLCMPRVVDAESIFSSMEVVYWTPMPHPVLRALVDHVSLLAKAEPARVMLVKLKAGGRITPHIDQGAYAEATDRYHLALTTNPDCVMLIGDERVAGRPDEIWWFDKHTPHAVINGGATDRVHLIVDCWR